MEDLTVGSLDTAAIMHRLPHRFPFLLVDRVLSCEPGHSIVGYKNITREEAHLSKLPEGSMPDTLVIEAMAQVAVSLARATLQMAPSNQALFFFAGIDNATFFGAASYGDRLTLESKVVRIMQAKGVGKFLTRASVDGRTVAVATMIAAMKASTVPVAQK
jgi:3-hydroxyacyl-[acyl-carrier-protein] dehydratase